jgi:retinol dehydrogenase 12
MSSFPSFIYQLLRDQWFYSIPKPKDSFEGQTIIVTGANTGLGLEASRHFVKLGAETVILACRSLEKADKAKADIERSTGKTDVVEVWHLDLGSYESVKAFAKRAESLQRLDVLVNNAGLTKSTFNTIEDNEETIVVNVISAFLLGVLLLPKLVETAKTRNTRPHLVMITSEVHFLTTLAEVSGPGNVFDILADESKLSSYGLPGRYWASKMLQILAVRAMIDTYYSPAEQSPVTINLVNPGFCRTEFAREQGQLIRIPWAIFHARTAEYGSRTLVLGAASGPETHGKYTNAGSVDNPSAFVTSDEGFKLQQRVWTDLSEKLEKIAPGLFEHL